MMHTGHCRPAWLRSQIFLLDLQCDFAGPLRVGLCCRPTNFRLQVSFKYVAVWNCFGVFQSALKMMRHKSSHWPMVPTPSLRSTSHSLLFNLLLVLSIQRALA